MGQVWLSPTDAPTLNREPWGLGIVDLRIGHVKTKTGHVYGSDGVAYGGQVPRHGITTVGRLDGIRRCLTSKDISRWPRLQFRDASRWCSQVNRRITTSRAALLPQRERGVVARAALLAMAGTAVTATALLEPAHRPPLAIVRPFVWSRRCRETTPKDVGDSQARCRLAGTP